jgi:hypothetical protein
MPTHLLKLKTATDEIMQDFSTNFSVFVHLCVSLSYIRAVHWTSKGFVFHNHNKGARCLVSGKYAQEGFLIQMWRTKKSKDKCVRRFRNWAILVHWPCLYIMWIKSREMWHFWDKKASIRELYMLYMLTT